MLEEVERGLRERFEGERRLAVEGSQAVGELREHRDALAALDDTGEIADAINRRIADLERETRDSGWAATAGLFGLKVLGLVGAQSLGEADPSSWCAEPSDGGEAIILRRKDVGIPVACDAGGRAEGREGKGAGGRRGRGALPSDKVERIRELHAAGRPVAEIAAEVGCSTTTAWKYGAGSAGGDQPQACTALEDCRCLNPTAIAALGECEAITCAEDLLELSLGDLLGLGIPKGTATVVAALVGDGTLAEEVSHA